MTVGHEWVEQIVIKVDGTNIPHDMMDKLVEAVIDSSLQLPDMFILQFTDTDNFDIIDDQTFEVGKDVEIQLGFDAPNQRTEKVFKGEITAIEPSFNSDVSASLVVRGYNKGHRLNRGTKMREFKNVKDSDIASKIAQENGLSAQVEATSEVYKHVYQHNQTDMEFLNVRAQRIGYEVYVDENKLYFQKPKGARGNAELEWGAQLRSFRPRLTTWNQVKKVTVKGWNPETKQALIGVAQSSQTSPKIGINGTGIDASSKFGTSPEEYVVRRPVYTQREAEILAQALLDEINAGYVEADGIAFGNPTLKAGMKVKIKKVGQKFSGEYIITAARHIYSLSGYETQFTVQGARPQLMTDLIESQSVFSNQERFWGGVVPAIVVNIQDPENKGRVELKYPWMDDNLKSDWARVATIGAGNERGLLWMPEVNDEVLVAFEQGDFNRPYVIGTLWNGKDKPPESWSSAVSNNKSEVRMLKSREGHIIKMVDGPSDKYIQIVDSAQGTTIKIDANSKQLSIESKDQISIKTNTSMKVETTSNVEIKASANVEITANGNVKISGTGNVEVTANGQLTLRGSMVNIN